MRLLRQTSLCALWNGLVNVVLMFHFLIPQTYADSLMREIYRVRDRDTPSGLYESRYSDAGHGEKVADLTNESIHEYFKSKSPESFTKTAFNLEDGKEISEVDETSLTPNDRRILYVVGLPLFGKERQETLELVKDLSKQKKGKFSDWFKDLFFLNKDKKETHIRPIGRPTGKWTLLQRLAYPMIWPVDMMPINPQVLKEGIQSVVISSAIGLTVQLMVQFGEHGDLLKALAVVLPTAALNLIQSAWTSLPRNWWQNYFKRAGAIAAPAVESIVDRSPKSDQVARIFGSVAQQLWMTLLFTFNVYFVSRGDLNSSLSLLSAAGLMEVLVKKWPSMAMNILWRTPTENALADYAESEGHGERGNMGDLEAAKIRKVLTIIATNLWVYSTLTSMNLDFLGAKWNLGHAGLALISFLGFKAWMKPSILRSLTKTGRTINKGCGTDLTHLTERIGSTRI